MEKLEMISLIERFHQLKAEQAARNIDPWLTRLESVRGTVDKGVEQISTQLLLDILEVPQHERAKNYRRLARLMASLGWTAQRMIGPTRGAYLDQVRGYSRDARQGRHPRGPVLEHASADSV
jgi:hypothetical protein